MRKKSSGIKKAWSKLRVEFSQRHATQVITRWKSELGALVRLKTGISAGYGKAVDKAKPGEGPKITDGVSIQGAAKTGGAFLLEQVMGEDTSGAKAEAGSLHPVQAVTNVASGAAKKSLSMFLMLSSFVLKASIFCLNALSLFIFALYVTYSGIKFISEKAVTLAKSLTTTPERRETAEMLDRERSKPAVLQNTNKFKISSIEGANKQGRDDLKL